MNTSMMNTSIRRQRAVRALFSIGLRLAWTAFLIYLLQIAYAHIG